MEDTPLVQSEPKPVAPAPASAPVRRRPPLSNVLSFVVGLVGIAALGASAWVYSESQREIVRISTDIAQLRLSIELFGRQHGTPSNTDTSSLQDITNRLTILEESWRSAPAPSATTVPEPAAAEAAAPEAASAGDCLPTGTRFLVTSGDSYPVCGVAANVEIGAVDNGFLSLADGTIIAAGGNIALPGTRCMIGVVSAGEDGMTSFAEIRVTC